MSKTLSVKLTTMEKERLDKMRCSDFTGSESRSEFIRLLLAREWNRRQGLPKPKASEWQGAFRIGRPKKVSV